MMKQMLQSIELKSDNLQMMTIVWICDTTNENMFNYGEKYNST